MKRDPEHLLLVAHDHPRRSALAAQFAQPGYALTVLDSMQQAVQTIQTEPVALVLLDIDHTTEDSLHLLHTLKGSDALRHIPVVLLTTCEQQRMVEPYIQAGADDYLIHPVSPVLLNARLERWLHAQRQARRQKMAEHKPELLKYYERDLQIGRQIQSSFLPLNLPEHAGWEIAARFQPARQVAGDFYDAFMLTQNRRIGFVIGDVCDKGVGAALFMALFRSLIRAFAQQHHTMSWADVLDSTLSDKPRQGAKVQRQALTMIGANALKNAVMMTNAYMVDNHRQARMYATLFFGVLDPASGTLIYVNGGHNPPLLIGQERIKSELEPTGPVVGIFPEADFAIQQVQFEPGDVLFCYTDGIPEAKSPDNSFFSEERMLELITQPADTATALVSRVEENVRAHMADGPQFDDITMLAVQRLPGEEADEEGGEKTTGKSARASADIKRDPLAYL